jgi:hypothetical protein
MGIIVDENSFRKRYLNDKFDDILSIENNPLINSNEHYLEYKNIYIELTEMNLINYLKMLDMIKNDNLVDHSNKKYIFNYVDDSIVERINIQIKQLIIDQNKLYNDFVNHIKMLNVVDIVSDKIILPVKSRMSELSNRNVS